MGSKSCTSYVYYLHRPGVTGFLHMFIRFVISSNTRYSRVNSKPWSNQYVLRERAPNKS